MEYEETKKDIKVVLVGGRGCGQNTARIALLGKAATQNRRQSLSMHQHNKKRKNPNSNSGQESTKQCLRTESARRCGRQITVEHTEDTVDDDYFHEHRNKLKAEVKGRQKTEKRKVVIFFIVYRKFTKDDDDMLDQFLCDLDFESRTKMFIALTDCVEDAECSQITCRQTLPIIHVNSYLTEKENEDQIKEIIKQIQKGKKLKNRKSGVIRIRWIRSARLFLLLALSVLDVLEAKATDVRRDAEIVKWNLMTKPVLFGEYVDIECIIKSGNTDKIMAWKKIPHGEIIALNTKPVDVGKYDARVVHNSSQMVYILRIKNFNTADVNLLYRCVYGFNSVGKNLSLNEKDFIAKPSEKDVKFNFSLTDSELSGNIQIRNGYPAPTCTGNFQRQKISEIVISNSNDSILFDSKIEIKSRTTICKGTIMVTCTYGNRDVLITDEKYICSSTTEDQSHSNRSVYGIAITSGVLLLLILVACFTIKKRYEILYMIIGQRETE